MVDSAVRALMGVIALLGVMSNLVNDNASSRHACLVSSTEDTYRPPEYISSRLAMKGSLGPDSIKFSHDWLIHQLCNRLQTT